MWRDVWPLCTLLPFFKTQSFRNHEVKKMQYTTLTFIFALLSNIAKNNINQKHYQWYFSHCNEFYVKFFSAFCTEFSVVRLEMYFLCKYGVSKSHKINDTAVSSLQKSVWIDIESVLLREESHKENEHKTLDFLA